MIRDTLTLSWRRSLLYKNQSIDLPFKSMDWFIYDRDLRHERVKNVLLFDSKLITCLRRPADTVRKLNVQKTFRRRPGRLLNVFCTFNLRTVSAGWQILKHNFSAKRNDSGPFVYQTRIQQHRKGDTKTGSRKLVSNRCKLQKSGWHLKKY